MRSMVIRLAELNIAVSYRHGFTEKLCREYVISDFDGNVDFSVSTSDEELEAEARAAEKVHGQEFSDGYVESICIYRAICRKLPAYDALLLHAAVISDGKRTYAFTAPSGTGKSTHIIQWRRAFGDEIFVINGDKPIVRFMDGQWHAFGTPWCGKENLQTNTHAPLSAVCFIKRSPENAIRRIDVNEAAERIMRQIIIPKDPLMALTTLDLLDRMIRHVPVWELECNISEDAARVARAAMSDGNISPNQ